MYNSLNEVLGMHLTRTSNKLAVLSQCSTLRSHDPDLISMKSQRIQPVQMHIHYSHAYLTMYEDVS